MALEVFMKNSIAYTSVMAGFGGKQRKARVRLGNATYKALEPAPGRYVKEKAS